MADGSLNFDTKLDITGFQKGLADISGVASTILKPTIAGIGELTNKLGEGVEAGIKYNATIDNYKTSLEAMIGSGKKATEVIGQLVAISASTPLKLEGLADTILLLMSLGTTVDVAVGYMKMLGEITLANEGNMDSLNAAYVQMSAAEKVQIENIDQMMKAGFAPLKEIVASTGESMASLSDRISNGKLSVDAMIASMQMATSEGGKFFDTMDKQSQSFSSQVSTIKGSADSLVGGVVEPISNSLTSSLLPSAMSSIEGIQKVFESKGVEGLVSAVGSMLGGVSSSAGEFEPKVAGLSTEVIGQLGQGLLENAPVILDSVGQIMDSVLTGIGETVPGLSPITDGLLTLGDNLSGITDIVGGTTGAFDIFQGAMDIQSIIVGFQEAQVSLALFSTTTDGMTIAQAALNGSLTIGETIVALFTGELTFAELATEALTVASGALNKVMEENMIAIVIIAIVALVAAFIYLWENCDAFRNFWIGLWDNITSLVVNAWNGIINFFTQTIPALIGQIGAFFSNLPANIGYWLGFAIGTLIKWGIDSIAWVIANVPLIIDNIGTFFSQLPGRLWDFLVSAALKILDWKNDLMGKGASAAGGLVDTIVNTISNLPNNMLNIGKNIVEGLWNGITGMADWIKDKVGGFANGVLDGVKNALGIHSPSRKFAWVGKMCVEGFEEPIEEYNPYDTLASSMQASKTTMQMNYDAKMSMQTQPNGFDYRSFGEATANALEKSGLSVQVDGRSFGRIVRGVALA